MRPQASALLRFSILGPVAASRDGEEIPLGGTRQRALLALLVVHANEVVASERLIEQAFDGLQSGRAGNALHVAVSRLRRALGDPEGRLLVTHRGGYQLTIERGQLDSAQFEQLLSEGRELLGHGQAVAATTRLAEALRLWHGPALVDVPAVDDVQLEVRRLEELRLVAEMERMDAELELGHAEEVVAELERLIARNPLKERLRGQLMVALYRSGRQAEALAVYRETSGLLRDELGLTVGPELRALERMILRHDAELEPGVAEAAREGAVLCPFKGLAAFESSDAEFFCGRDRTVSDLVARLAEWPLVGILGPSGIGKSSLLRAGVLPALSRGALPGSSRWRQVLLRPGSQPLRELRLALEGEVATALGALGRGERLVIAVDQLEELFTVCDREPERRGFLARLAEAAGDHERRVLVVCVLRGDFYGRLSAYPRFAELLSRSHVLVGPMSRAELREVIERPAARARLRVEPGLVDALVGDVGEEPGGLPLLSTTLLELWRAREERVLRLEHYRTTGGVRGAVARIGEAAYIRLSEHEQDVARTVLVRLADCGDGEPSRRRVPLSEIEQVDGAERVVKKLTEARLLTAGGGAVELSHEALLREWPRYRGWLDEDRVGQRLHSHLRVAAAEWAARGRDPGDLYRGARLAAALDFCAEQPERLDLLEREFLTAGRVEADRETRRQRSQNRRLRALLLGAGVLLILTVAVGVVAVLWQRQASVDARIAVTEEQAALGRQLGAEALNESRLDTAALLARGAVALDRSGLTEGTLLSVLLRTPAVIATLSLPSGSAPQVAVSPDGRTLAVSDTSSGRLRLYDAGTYRASARFLSDFRGDQPPAYSEDGTLIVYPAGSSLVVRDARTLRPRRRLPIPAPFNQALTSDIPDGSIAVSPRDDAVYYAYWLVDSTGRPSEAYLSGWSLRSGRLLTNTRLGPGPLMALRLIDRGGVVMVVSSREITTYDARTGRLIRARRIQPAPLLPTAAAISPSGARIVIGSESGSVSFVDAEDGLAVPAAGGHAGAVESVIYERDGRTAVTVGADGKAIVWDTVRRTQRTVLIGPGERLREATVDPGGATLYTAEVGGGVLAWDLTGTRTFGRSARLGQKLPCCDPISPLSPPLARSPDGTRFAVSLGPSLVGVFSTSTLRLQARFAIRPAGDPITALAWSPTAGTVAVGAHGGVVQLWSVAGEPRLERSLAGLMPYPGQREAIHVLAFSPDGAVLIAADERQTTSLGRRFPFPFATMARWRVSDGELIGAPSDLGAGQSLNGSDTIAFSPDRRLLAVTQLAGDVRIVAAGTGRVLRTLGNPSDHSISLGFAPGGTLAVGTLAGTVELWDPNTGKRLGTPLQADTEAITGIAFDPTGQMFATSSFQTGTVKLWTMGSLQQEGPRLASDPDATSAAAFGPSGDDLLVIDDHGGAFTWPMSLGFWEQRACWLAGGNLTPATWAQFVGNSRYADLCVRSADTGR